MAMFWSPSDGHFYHPDVHGDAVPRDVLKVTHTRYQQLLAGRGEGRAIVLGATGRPTLTPHRPPTTAQLRGDAVARIKIEAGRRILALASLERQINDAAAIALGSPADEYAAALARRTAINAIRATSNALEDTIATWAAGALSKFDAGADAHWPTSSGA